MRRLFTSADGLTESALRWGVRTGRWVRIERGVYAEGCDPPDSFDRARARVLACGGVARGCLAGVLHDLDGVRLDGRPTRRTEPDEIEIIHGVPCARARQTLVDLAAVLDDDRWEQALECALRRRLVALDDFDGLPSRRAEAARIRRVLERRPPGAPATESVLETLAVQLFRTVPGLSDPTRQHLVTRAGVFVARVDLCWPDLGLFVELDGQQHRGQPVYDASRETAVVAATGWLCARFTWHEIVAVPRTTARRIDDIAAHCRRLRTA